MFTIINATLYNFVTLLMYSYYGALVTDSFMKNSVHLFALPWHELPIEYQKYFLLMISNTRHPIGYKANGLIAINLEKFRNVLDQSNFY